MSITSLTRRYFPNPLNDRTDELRCDFLNRVEKTPNLCLSIVVYEGGSDYAGIGQPEPPHQARRVHVAIAHAYAGRSQVQAHL